MNNKIWIALYITCDRMNNAHRPPHSNPWDFMWDSADVFKDVEMKQWSWIICVSRGRCDYRRGGGDVTMMRPHAKERCSSEAKTILS